MEEAMQLQPNWDFRIHESAQRSIAAGHYFFSCISGQAHKRSPQELSIIAEGAILEFKKLISILDSSVLHSTKRIKKGPLFNNPSINPSELTEKLISPASVANYQQKQSSNLTHPFLRPSESFNLSRQSHSSLIQRCYSDTDLTLANNPFSVLDGSVSQASTADPSRQTNESSVSLQLNSFGYKSILQFSSSSMQSAPEDFSVRFGGIREEGSSKCAASTGGCHCSKRKKLRIKRTIRVPAVSSKLSDIPSDDFSWRKYGQKPIKGSPYPRSYYKCSSLRGCPARKHVERSLEDPSMLVITYEGHHSHSRITFGIPNILIQQQH